VVVKVVVASSKGILEGDGWETLGKTVSVGIGPAAFAAWSTAAGGSGHDGIPRWPAAARTAAAVDGGCGREGRR
jgi:hypothetical protein